jgi:hypothetical protein
MQQCVTNIYNNPHSRNKWHKSIFALFQEKPLKKMKLLLALSVGNAVTLEMYKDFHKFTAGKQEELIILSRSRYIATSKGHIHGPTLTSETFHTLCTNMFLELWLFIWL